MEKEYGDKPKLLGKITIDSEEMMFIQYMPIKLIYTKYPSIPTNLMVFERIIIELRTHIDDPKIDSTSFKVHLKIIEFGCARIPLTSELIFNGIENHKKH